MASRTGTPPVTHARPARAASGPVLPPRPAPAVRVPQHLRVAGTPARRAPLAAVAAVGLVAASMVLAVWVGQGGPSRSSTPAGTATRALPGAVDTTASRPPSSASSADQLRLALVTALSEHLVLTDRLARAGLRGEQDLAGAGDIALQRSSRTWRTALSGLTADASLRGERATTGSLTAVFAYAAARAEGDEAGALAARARVTAETRGLSDVLVDAADGALDAVTTERGLQQYADGLVRHVDAGARGDLVEAYEEERRTYAYASHLGTVLADGLSEGLGLPAAALTAVDRERLHLQRLFAEHAALALDVVAAHVRGGSDPTAAAAALKANGAELAWAAGRGRDATTTRFARLWQTRVEALVTYSRAVATDAPGSAREALVQLERTSRPIVDLLEPGRPPAAGTLLPSLQQQDQLLVRQAADLAAADAPAAQRAFGDALDHGRELGRLVAETLTGAPVISAAAGGS